MPEQPVVGNPPRSGAHSASGCLPSLWQARRGWSCRRRRAVERGHGGRWTEFVCLACEIIHLSILKETGISPRGVISKGDSFGEAGFVFETMTEPRRPETRRAERDSRESSIMQFVIYCRMEIRKERDFTLSFLPPPTALVCSGRSAQLPQ